MSQEKRRLPGSLDPYWYLIIFFLLLVAGFYVYHLLTGVTPNRVALRIEALNFDIYWYGIWIVGGIALGCYVVYHLALERAQRLFDETVPQEIQSRSLAGLSLSKALQQKLSKNKIETLGQLLFSGGLDPRNLGLKKEETSKVTSALRRAPGVEASWLDDAPWRAWNPDHVWNGIIWIVILALIGARIYHILTPSPSMAALGINSPLDYFRNPLQMLNIRSGGLGIYGGLAGGALGLFLYTRRQGISTLAWADIGVVGLALGQVFGRWGNFFNQELYGKPSNLPWAVTIDPAHRLPAYSDVSRFHPAFLYESLWSLLAFFVLYVLARRYADRLLTGELMGLYLIFYATGRVLLELVRLDSRTIAIAGFNLDIAVATLVSIIVAVLTAAWLLWRRRRQGRVPGGVHQAA